MDKAAVAAWGTAGALDVDRFILGVGGNVEGQAIPLFVFNRLGERLVAVLLNPHLGIAKTPLGEGVRARQVVQQQETEKRMSPDQRPSKPGESPALHGCDSTGHDRRETGCDQPTEEA